MFQNGAEEIATRDGSTTGVTFKNNPKQMLGMLDAVTFSRWERFENHKLTTLCLDFYCLKQGIGSPTAHLGSIFVDATVII